MSGKADILLVLVMSAVVTLGACGAGSRMQVVEGTTAAKNLSDKQLVLRLAEEMDQGCADGWIAGREPRIFKSGYRRKPSVRKAQFAMEYAEFLAARKENLGKNISSYVPYDARAIFAYDFWRSDPDFQKASEHIQNYWIHESLLDAGELYWRALEGTKPPDSTAVIAHDTEQNMVFKFMESEHEQGTRDGFRTGLNKGEK